MLSLDYPKAYDVSDPYTSRLVGLDELKHWELAPSNAARVHAAGIEFALTADGLESPSGIRSAVWTSMRHGLPEVAALAALTEIPAKLIGASDRVGRIAKGLEANVLITDGPIFHPDAQLLENWVQGEQHTYVNRHEVDVRGTYNLAVADRVLSLEVTGELSKPKAKVIIDSTDYKVDFAPDGRQRGARFGVHNNEVLVQPRRLIIVTDALARGDVEGKQDLGSGEGARRDLVRGQVLVAQCHGDDLDLATLVPALRARRSSGSLAPLAQSSNDHADLLVEGAPPKKLVPWRPPDLMCLSCTSHPVATR